MTLKVLKKVEALKKPVVNQYLIYKDVETRSLFSVWTELQDYIWYIKVTSATGQTWIRTKESVSEVISLFSWTFRRLWTCLWWHQLHTQSFIFSAETRRLFAQRAGWRPRSCRDASSVSVPINTPLSLLRRICFTWIYEVLLYYRVVISDAIQSWGGDETLHSVEKLYCSTTVEK